jgi:hypothetical protein
MEPCGSVSCQFSPRYTKRRKFRLFRNLRRLVSRTGLVGGGAPNKES